MFFKIKNIIMEASNKILDFFKDPKTIRALIGKEAKLSIEFDPIINKDDEIKFKNREVNSLEVETLGKAIHFNITIPMIIKPHLTFLMQQLSVSISSYEKQEIRQNYQER